MTSHPRVRAALSWALRGYALVALATAPLALAPMPSRPVPCGNATRDLAWAVWLYRETVWLSLAFSLPVAALATAVLASKTTLSPRRAAAVGTTVGLILAAATTVYTIANPICEVRMEQIDP